MKLVVKANTEQKQYLESLSTNATFIFINSANEEIPEDVTAFFDLTDDETVLFFNEKEKPVFKSAVSVNASQLPENYVRITAWASFFEREKWEVFCTQKLKDNTIDILKNINKTPVFTEDVAGFISARAVAMIINEAFFALGENISTKDEIDTAMKLGVNYPLGPFEWSEKIGLEKIKTLLKALHNSDSSRYSIAPLLQ